MLDLNAQHHKPLRDIIYDDLKMGILTGKILPGTRLLEVELADKMGVSRTPVREAIRRLEKEGLVNIEPRHGAYAAKVSVEDMIEILEVRELMESMAAQLAANRITQEQLDALLQTENEYQKAVKSGDVEDMIVLDSKFHKQVVEASHNRTLYQLIEPLQEIALRFRYMYYNDNTRAEKMPSEHERILKALSQGNGEAARKAAEKHLRSIKEKIKG
mgnify:CR=1 FL=1